MTTGGRSGLDARPAAAVTRARPTVPLLSRVLVALAALLTVVALLGTWVDRQVLNTPDWERTSAELLREDAIRVPLGDYLASAIADGSRVSAAVRQAGQSLPPQLQPLADAASGAAGSAAADAAQRGVQRVLANATVQQAWVAASTAAQRQLVRLIEGENLEVAGQAVYLDLRPVARQTAQALGYSGSRVEQLPADRTRVRILREDQLSALQTIGRVLRALSWLPAILALALCAAAIWRAPGARRRVVLASGLSLAGAGLLVLVLRRLAGRAITDAITTGGPLQPAASSAWKIASTLLEELCAVVLIIGLCAASGAWLAGPGSRASWLRARIAPWLLDRPGLAYGAVAVAYLALIAWGPLSVLTRAWPIIVFAVLLAAGMWTFRAQLVAERQAAE
jgi:hypothetical protein